VTRIHDSVSDNAELRAITEYAEDYIILYGLDFRHLFVSRSVARALGREPEDFPGHTLEEMGLPPALAAQLRACMARVLESGTPERLEYRLRVGGSTRLMSCTMAPMRKVDGSLRGLIGVTRDQTDHRRALEALQDRESRLARALEASALGTWEWNLDSGALLTDERCARLLGRPPDGADASARSVLASLPPEDLQQLNEAVQAHLRGQAPAFECECRTQTGAGSHRWVRTRGQVSVRDSEGRPRRVAGTILDISDERRMQDRLDTATQRVQLLLEATDEGTIGLEPDGSISFVNPAAMQLLGCDADSLLGHDFHSVIRHTREDGVDLIGHDSPIHRCLTEGRRHRSGGDDLFTCGERCFPVDFSVSPIMTDTAGEGAVLVFHDVSDKRRLSHQLNFQALHDPLTGLINRRGFEERLAILLASAKQDGREHALCYLDLDHFKLINDTCGHAAGDELLRQLPKLLQPMVRAQDTVARLGGDEFALLLDNCPLEQAARVAEQVRDAVKGIRFVWQYRSFSIGASIGVVGITADSQGAVAVLGAADAACYVAKDQGPNNIHVSYPHDLAIIRRRGEMRWIARLKNALEENRFTLYYQSIQALRPGSGTPLHHELLIRLLDAKDEIILPGAFVGAAERYQLMPQIDEWVVGHALRFLGEAVARQPQLARHRFGINLSGESLRDQRLLEVIRSTLAAQRVPPAMLYFEITETAAISNLGAAVEFMQGLRQLGCQLALDDFGSGMSSFSYLKHLPVDYLKIDGSFVRDMHNSAVDQTIVRAINSVGQQMGIRTIAEFVETRGVLEILREIGVDYAQGFGIALPQPLEEFAAVAGDRVAV